jgi:hypothetical protein
MQTSNYKRRHSRLAHRAKIQLSNANESIVAYTKDLSDSGLYVLGSFSPNPHIGDIMEVLILDIENAITRPVVVRRVEPRAGIAVEFI